MREWHLTASDPMDPRIAADARSGRTTLGDDQIWQLSLGAPDKPALALETRYGGRVGLARLVPIWQIGRRQIYEAQGYSQPPVIAGFAPDWLRLAAALTPAVQVEIDFWTMESQAVGGRFTLHNTGAQAASVQLDLVAQIVTTRNAGVQILFLTLQNGQSALQLGRLEGLQPVLLLEGAAGTGTRPRLTRTISLGPGQRTAVRWTLASLPTRDESLLLAHKWLVQNWDPQFAAIERRARAQPEIETGNADWDAALAWGQQVMLRSFLGATGSLPFASFVSARRPLDGYPLGGTHASGFNAAWGGQSLPDALLIAPSVALAAPELAKGIVRNFLAVQRHDGWIDARPGLDGQRTNVLAPPLLATLAYTVYHYTRDKTLLADAFPWLRLFFERWFKPDMDRDGDGLPEWSEVAQGAVGGSLFGSGPNAGQGLDISTVESPDLAVYLVREASALVRIAEALDRPEDAEALTARHDWLAVHLRALWDPDARMFRPRDRDTHATPAGDVIYEGKGDQPLRERTALPTPSRLILRTTGGLTRKPALSCTVEGVNAGGQPAHEDIPADRFDWYRSSGAATTRTVWQEITYVKFSGLSRVYAVQVSTANLSQEDLSWLVPLWTDALDDDQAGALIAALTDPARYWRIYGLPGCPADGPAYRDGGSVMWPYWNMLLAWALMDRGRHADAADLFRRVLAAQIRSLSSGQSFRASYNADTGEGLGDSGVISGAVSLAWFARLFGAYVPAPDRAVISGPLAFEDERMAWTQHGVRITRGADGTTVRFPSGGEVTLPPDATPQVVRDPSAAPASPAPAPVEPGPPADDEIPPGGDLPVEVVRDQDADLPFSTDDDPLPEID